MDSLHMRHGAYKRCKQLLSSFVSTVTLKSSNEKTDAGTSGKPLGASFVALSILTLVLGTARFFRIQKQLTGGKFSPSRIEVSINALITSALLIATFGVVLGMRLTAFT